MSADAFLSGLLLGAALLIPLGLRWELDRKIVIPAALLIGIASGAAVEVLARLTELKPYQRLLVQLPLIGSISLSLLLWRFYRDPERVPPQTDGVILSPADGRILYVRKIEAGEIPLSEKDGRKFPLAELAPSSRLPGEGYLVGIAMNFLDVHVNRAPIAGKVTFIRRIPGRFLSLRVKEAVLRNERALTVIEGDSLTLGIVQIASRLVRCIVSYVAEGSTVGIGQRIGMIRFGSQVDLVIPRADRLRVVVRPGERVQAGISVIASLNRGMTPLPADRPTGGRPRAAGRARAGGQSGRMTAGAPHTG